MGRARPRLPSPALRAFERHGVFSRPFGGRPSCCLAALHGAWRGLNRHAPLVTLWSHMPFQYTRLGLASHRWRRVPRVYLGGIRSRIGVAHRRRCWYQSGERARTRDIMASDETTRQHA